MNTERASDTSKAEYRVVSVEKTDPPAGVQDGNWHRYVISQGESEICGCKSGTLKAVTQHAESFAEDLNARSAKGYSAYAPNRRK
jgi:hypothetical protein